MMSIIEYENRLSDLLGELRDALNRCDFKMVPDYHPGIVYSDEKLDEFRKDLASYPVENIRYNEQHRDGRDLQVFADIYKLRSLVSGFKATTFRDYWKVRAKENFDRGRPADLYFEILMEISTNVVEHAGEFYRNLQLVPRFKDIETEVKALSILFHEYRDIVASEKDQILLFSTQEILLPKEVADKFLLILMLGVQYRLGQLTGKSDLSFLEELEAEEIETERNKVDMAKVIFPEYQSGETKFNQKQHLKFYLLLAKLELIRPDSKNRHLAYAINLTTGLSYKQIEKSDLKSIQIEFNKIENAEKLDYETKTEWTNDLEEIQKQIRRLDLLIEGRLNQIRSTSSETQFPS
jgi:hypothetical protein